MLARITAWLACCLVVAGCGDAGVADYFESEGDSYIGGPGPGQEQQPPEQPTGDPCAADSPWSCHPVSGEGCDGEDRGCDFGFHGGVWGFFCFSDCTEPLGAPCDQEDGPWCASGMTCREGLCTAFCCQADDCPDGEVCDPAEWSPPLESGPGFCVLGFTVPTTRIIRSARDQGPGSGENGVRPPPDPPGLDPCSP